MAKNFMNLPKPKCPPNTKGKWELNKSIDEGITQLQKADEYSDLSLVLYHDNKEKFVVYYSCENGHGFVEELPLSMLKDLLSNNEIDCSIPAKINNNEKTTEKRLENLEKKMSILEEIDELKFLLENQKDKNFLNKTERIK